VRRSPFAALARPGSVRPTVQIPDTGAGRSRQREWIADARIEIEKTRLLGLLSIRDLPVAERALAGTEERERETVAAHV